jgi:DNA-binding CsgD family transcriptional regulator
LRYRPLGTACTLERDTEANMRKMRKGVPDVCRELERGREFCKRRAWADAHQVLSLADNMVPLGAEDLELLAMSAYLIARDDEYLKVLNRAYDAHLDEGASVRAARCAFWLGLRLAFRGEAGRATGWLARSRRLIECEEGDCVEEGYLLLPVAEEQLEAGNSEGAYATAADACKIGTRFGERDLVAIARHVQGRAWIQQGRVTDGLALLDEAMLEVTSGDLSPLVTGLVYCSVIDGCQQVFAVSRAREWTTALARWCDEQPEMVTFTGKCLVHRAEILQLHGAWAEALAEARRGCERFERGIDPQRPASAFYQLAEVHRLRGEFAEAEQAYRSASTWGMEPQPGLALLRLAQGRLDIAAGSIRRVVDATRQPLQLARLLPAYIEIMLETGESERARSACQELDQVIERFDTGLLGGIAAHARGALALAEGDAQKALVSLRLALQVWQQVEAPYLLARTRFLIGVACSALGDDEAAALETDSARTIFEQLGAVPDLARIVRRARDTASHQFAGLTPRELQVLRLIATGRTNKAIAAELCVSDRTVDRHVSNILTKLSLPSRAAATAYAYRHSLI